MAARGKDAGDSGAVAHGASREFTEKVLGVLREKLLDLTRRNRTLNYKHSDRARTHIRVIDEMPDYLFEMIASGKKMTFKPLPAPVDRPKDEQTPEYKDAFDAAMLTDEEFRMAMDALDPDADNTEEEWRIERALRDRVREKLDLPVRPHKAMKVQEYARGHCQTNWA
jgi:hypothetical protein